MYTFTFSTRRMFRGYMWSEFEDEAFTIHSLTDADDLGGSAGVFNYRIVDENGNLPSLVSNTTAYELVSPDTFDVIVSGTGFAAEDGWDFGTATYPSTMTLNIATEPADQTEWTDHIATDLVDAEAVYLVDVTDPADWPEEFQLTFAAEMARRAALVHAKSTKMVQGLGVLAAEEFSEAIGSLTADDGTIEGGQMSGAEKARL